MARKKQRQAAVANQWQLMRWRFLKHKVAVVSLIIVVILYFIAAFCEFLAPNTSNMYSSKFMYAPPMEVGLFVKGEDGSIRLQLHVKGYEAKLNKMSGKWEYTTDENYIIPIKLFVHRDTYKFWGLWETDLHLFGPEDPSQPFYLWGADRMGHCLFSRVLYGARISLSIGLIGVFMSLFLGVLIGGISGYYGGVVDNLIQRLIEVVQSIPAIPLWMAIAAAVPKEWSIVKTYFAMTLILAFINWTGLARVVRGRFMALKSEDFVTVARLNGCSTLKIVFKHMLPSFLSHIIAQVTLSIPRMIISETSLSYLGLGLRDPAVSWGVLLQDAQSMKIISTAPWLLIAPTLFIVISVLAMNFLGDGLRDAADPYNS